MLCMLAAEVLRHAGFAITEADCGETARQPFDNHDFDRMLLDVMMPGIDGYAVCQLIRRHATGKWLPIVYAGLAIYFSHLPIVTSIPGHPWQTRFRGKLAISRCSVLAPCLASFSWERSNRAGNNARNNSGGSPTAHWGPFFVFRRGSKGYPLAPVRQARAIPAHWKAHRSYSTLKMRQVKAIVPTKRRSFS